MDELLQRLENVMSAVQLTVLAEQHALVNALGLPKNVALDWIARRSGAASPLTRAAVGSGELPDLNQVNESLREVVSRAGCAGVAIPLLNITCAGFPLVVDWVGADLTSRAAGDDAESWRHEPSTDRPAVAFFGLGRMGAPLATRLVQAGFPVTVYNRSPEPTEPFARQGVRVADTPAAAADGARFLITCMTDGLALQAVAEGPAGFLATAAPSSTWIDLSTCSRSDSLRLAKLAANHSVTLVDAAMSGGVVQAQSGQLPFLVGGSEQEVLRGRDLLMTMGSDLVHAGSQGDGHSLKLISNALFTCPNVGLAEICTIAPLFGVAREQWLDHFTAGRTAGTNLVRKSEMMRRGHYPSGSAINFTVKDLRYTLEMASDFGLDMPVTATAWALYRMAQKAGFGLHDPAAILGWLETLD